MNDELYHYNFCNNDPINHSNDALFMEQDSHSIINKMLSMITSSSCAANGNFMQCLNDVNHDTGHPLLN
jgi:hypothetical protein